MSRLRLLALQLLVAILTAGAVAVVRHRAGVRKVLLPPFFFSNPVDVFSQILAWFASGVI